MRSQSYYLVVCLLLMATAVLADEPRITTFFQSKDGHFTLQATKGRWKLKNQKGRTLYSINDAGYASMLIFVSDDGQKLVVINDFVQGHLLGSQLGLAIFCKGQLVGSYRITELVKDTCNVAHSIWHTTWSLDDCSFVKSDSIFSVATFEFNELEFNVFNGSIVKNKRPAPLDSTTSIVIGHFYKGKADQSTLQVLQYIAGPKPVNNQLLFKPKKFGEGTWVEALAIKDGEDVTPDRFRGGSFANACMREESNNQERKN